MDNNTNVFHFQSGNQLTRENCSQLAEIQDHLNYATNIGIEIINGNYKLEKVEKEIE